MVRVPSNVRLLVMPPPEPVVDTLPPVTMIGAEPLTDGVVAAESIKPPAHVSVSVPATPQLSTVAVVNVTNP